MILHFFLSDIKENNTPRMIRLTWHTNFPQHILMFSFVWVLSDIPTKVGHNYVSHTGGGKPHFEE